MTHNTFHIPYNYCACHAGLASSPQLNTIPFQHALHMKRVFDHLQVHPSIARKYVTKLQEVTAKPTLITNPPVSKSTVIPLRNPTKGLIAGLATNTSVTFLHTLKPRRWHPRLQAPGTSSAFHKSDPRYTSKTPKTEIDVIMLRKFWSKLPPVAGGLCSADLGPG